MPSSRPHSIPFVVNLIRVIKPASILEIGPGFGKWGVLFREYTDIIASEHDPPRYLKENWKVRIDCIEIYPKYLTPVHYYIYNHIYPGNALEMMEDMGNYDIIFMGDVIEHFPKEEGLKLIETAKTHANKAIIIITPAAETHQQEICGNPYEVHLSLWRKEDFKRIGGVVVHHHGNLLIAMVTDNEEVFGRLKRFQKCALSKMR